MEKLEFRVEVVEVTNSKKSLSRGDKDVSKVVLDFPKAGFQACSCPVGSKAGCVR